MRYSQRRECLVQPQVRKVTSIEASERREGKAKNISHRRGMQRRVLVDLNEGERGETCLASSECRSPYWRVRA